MAMAMATSSSSSSSSSPPPLSSSPPSPPSPPPPSPSPSPSPSSAAAIATATAAAAADAGDGDGDGDGDEDEGRIAATPARPRPPAPARCALHGCHRPVAASFPSSRSHLTCGEFHHLLLMASRFDPSSPPPHAPILDRNRRGLCGLPSCPNPPYLLPSGERGAGGSRRTRGNFCCKTHYLAWLSDFCTHGLSARQICKLQGCPRHVFVEVEEEAHEEAQEDSEEEEEEEEEAVEQDERRRESAEETGEGSRGTIRSCRRSERPWIRSTRRKVHEFCGWKHRQVYAMLQAYSSYGERQAAIRAESSSSY